ncbi:MAG TPA: hypothetical protein VFL14_15225 [Xanthomonadales bacterium]|nr:hypothetical protein [Xanthomonadales bacterium]
MSTDPYAPPGAPIIPDKRGASAFVAVLVGLAIDVGGSIVLSMVLGFGYAILLVSNGTDPDKIAETIMAGGSTSFQAIAMTLGGVLSILGGYTCTRMARRRDYRLGIVLACISIAITTLMTVGAYSLARHAGNAALEFALVMVGTRLGFVRA